MQLYHADVEGSMADLSCGVRLDLTGARWHLRLERLVHLVVILEQADFGSFVATLTEADRWL